MSRSICNPNCITSRTKTFNLEECDNPIRKYGSEQFLEFACSVSFDNILDTAEWCQKITDGEIIVSPCGAMDIGDASTDIAGTSGCGREYPDVTEYPFTFQVWDVPADYSDEDWMCDWFDKHSLYNLGVMDCNGRIQLDKRQVREIKDAIAAGTTSLAMANVGIPYSVTNPPQWKANNGNGKRGRWEGSGTFDHAGVLISVEIPGLVEAINECLATLGGDDQGNAAQ